MSGFGWVIVQHSGYGYTGKAGFERAVETRGLQTNAERTKVEKAGGVVFATYMEAEDFTEKANYPEDNSSIYPAAKGTFSEKTLDGLRIYIPVRSVVA